MSQPNGLRMRNHILIGMLCALASFGVHAQRDSACQVAEDDLFGVFVYESGPGDFSSIELFWEHGDYIFNVHARNAGLLVGEWSFNRCVLRFSHYVDGSREVVRLEIKSLENGVLIVAFPRSSAETRFRRAA